MTWSLVLALALPAMAGAPEAAAEREVRAVFVKVETLLARASGQDARSVAALDQEIESLAPAVRKWGWRAVDPLSRILADRGLPLKERLFALSFMGLGHDPLALPPLKKLLLDPEAPALLRSAAAENLPLLDVSRPSVRAVLCAALVQEDLPEETALPVLQEAARLGCDETGTLEGRLKRCGHRPEGRARDAAALAIAALGRSRPLEAARVLLRLLSFYPAGSPLKTACLRALWERRRDLLAFKDEAFSALTGLIKSEPGRPLAAAAAIPLLASLREPDAIPLLRRCLADPDAEVATLAAEALADLQFLPAREEIGRILADVHEDKRFAPAPGRPDPRSLVQRLQAAQNRLR